jgi:hypothetical protein
LKLLRLAVASFDLASDAVREFRFPIDNVAVQSIYAREKDGKLMVLMCGSTRLATEPAVDLDNRVLVPDTERIEIEDAIEFSASLVGLANGASCVVRTPMRCILFLGETSAELEWLHARAGVAGEPGFESVLSGKCAFSLTDTMVQGLSDRKEGVVLLSNALSAHGMSRYRELIRFFEMAFGKANRFLPEPLAKFLGRSRFGFTPEIVHTWVPELRHRCTHADRPERGIASARDVEPFTPQMMVAAYDVLLNKTLWNSSDDDRRQLWGAQSAPSQERETPPGVVVEHHKTMDVHWLMLDRWRRFPLEPADYVLLLQSNEHLWPVGPLDDEDGGVSVLSAVESTLWVE